MGDCSTVEITVYLNHRACGKGFAKKLYDELFARLKQKSIHALIAVIALPNAKSIELHEKYGMKQVGHFKEVGFKFEKWIDVGYWQLLLES